MHKSDLSKNKIYKLFSFVGTLTLSFSAGVSIHNYYITYTEVSMNLFRRRALQSLYLCALSLLLLIQQITYSTHLKSTQTSADGTKYIKWIDFDISSKALTDAVKYDVESKSSDIHTDAVTLLSLLATKYGGSFKNYKKADMDKICEKLKAGEKPESIAANLKTYNYYTEAYGAVLGGLVGDYATPCDYDENGLYYEKRYGLKLFSPIAAGYYYNHYDDFGAARSFGYKRVHLGHDMMGSVGTPIVAVESGIVEALGWNRFGGWRIGIRSFDSKRYYYYAHLRKGHPYAADMYEGKIVNAGDVIGYLGMTGYSSKEDTNNINVPHLHFGMQIIFDKSQKEGWNQIWLDMYEFTNFLSKNKAEVAYDKESGEHYSKSSIIDLSTPD